MPAASSAESMMCVSLLREFALSVSSFVEGELFERPSTKWFLRLGFWRLPSTAQALLSRLWSEEDRSWSMRLHRRLKRLRTVAWWAKRRAQSEFLE